ncbi:MAG: hypothetical protein JKY01_02805 [Pseudomonadales bacterium]|nr:hypothetical protein [Pseudomonadales bacterium]
MNQDQSLFSITYDSQEDRLTLTLKNHQGQIEGKMTRRLLRGFIAGLPGWLERQVAAPLPSQEAVALPQNPAGKVIPPVASEAITSATPVCVAKNNSQFLIVSIRLLPLNQQSEKPAIRVGFMSQDNQQKIGINLSLDELTAVVTALVEKPEDWGLAHPWPNNALGTMTQHRDRIFH